MIGWKHRQDTGKTSGKHTSTSFSEVDTNDRIILSVRSSILEVIFAETFFVLRIAWCGRHKTVYVHTFADRFPLGARTCENIIMNVSIWRHTIANTIQLLFTFPHTASIAIRANSSEMRYYYMLRTALVSGPVCPGCLVLC